MTREFWTPQYKSHVNMFLLIVTFLLFCFIFNKLTCGITKSPTCLLGKTAIVTGGDAGLGYEICLNLASRGCRIIIADKNDSSETRNRIIRLTNNKNIISKKLDLSSFKSIRNFANEINSTEEKLDILINNAGIGGSTAKSTEDGLNPVMQVNYFGPFLLTHLLIDLLKRSGSGRIIFTSSCAAFLGRINLDTFASTDRCDTLFTALEFYSKAKLATIIASDIFAEKLKVYGVTSNSLHPGIIFTKIYNTFDERTITPALLLRVIVYIFGKSTWEGSQTTVHLATSPDVQNVTGKYFWDCISFVKPFQMRNAQICKQIWSISEECVGLSPQEKF